jgi:hypothetical protein
MKNMNLNNLLGNIGIKSNLAGDMSFLIVFLLVSFAVSFVLGKHRILVSLLGVYVAYAVVNLASFDFLKDAQTKTLIFLAVLIGFVMTLTRIIHSSISGHGPAFYAKLTIGTAIVIGLSLSFVLSWHAAKDLENIVTPSVKMYFTNSLYRFLWAIAPLVYLGIVRKRID